MVNYKIIEINDEQISNPVEKEAINQLAAFYPKDDIYFEVLENKLIANLRQIDFANFKSSVEDILFNSNGYDLKLLPCFLGKER